MHSEGQPHCMADLEMSYQSEEHQKGRHSRKQGGDKMLIKSHHFTVSLFLRVFFFSIMLNLVLKVPRDDATTFFLKSYLQVKRNRLILSFLILYISTLTVMLSVCTTLKTIMEKKNEMSFRYLYHVFL